MSLLICHVKIHSRYKIFINDTKIDFLIERINCKTYIDLTFFASLSEYYKFLKYFFLT